MLSAHIRLTKTQITCAAAEREKARQEQCSSPAINLWVCAAEVSIPPVLTLCVSGWYPLQVTLLLTHWEECWCSPASFVYLLCSWMTNMPIFKRYLRLAANPPHIPIFERYHAVGIQSPTDASLIFKSLRKWFWQIDNGKRSCFEEGMPLVWVRCCLKNT